MKKTIEVVIEPPEDHPNRDMVSGERIPVKLEVENLSPWHEPLVGWVITEVWTPMMEEA